MSLSVYLFGQFKILANNTPINLQSRPAQSLLAYLSLTAGTNHRREMLASMLWPDTTDSNARSYLRQALWRIRKAFEECDLPCVDYLHITDLCVMFNPNSDYWLDANMILLPTKEQSTQQMVEHLQHYKGELLPGFYDEWISPERERFQAMYHQKMSLLLDRLTAAEAWADTIKWGEQWIKLGYAPEPAFRALMRAYANFGDRGMINATYQRCEKALEQELSLAPSPETQELYQHLCHEGTSPNDFESARVINSPPPEADIFSGEPTIKFEKALFVARKNELAKLNQSLERALTGDGQQIFIVGEAGSGKTALISEFINRTVETYPGLIIASGTCNAQTGIGDPYLPFREILELLTGDVFSRWFAGNLSDPLARALWNNLPQTARALVENGESLLDTFINTTSLLERAKIIGQDYPEWLRRLENLAAQKRSHPYTPQSHQGTFFEQYTSVLHDISRQVALVLVIDDLQWADIGSISLLFHLGRHLAGSRIMIIGAYRPEEIAIGREDNRHPLAPVVRELQRLHGDILIDMDRAESREFMEEFIDSEPNLLGPEFREMLYRQTLGHPLFMIELLRGLQERGDLVQNQDGFWMDGSALDWETLPARVEAVITERIDRLPAPLQKTLQIASVEGDVFTAEVVAKVMGTDTHRLLSQLSDDLDRKHRLVKAQSIQRLDGQLISCYRFRHIQIQKYLYSSLDQVERVHLHEQIGRELENIYASENESTNLAQLSSSITPVVLLAHHFLEAKIYSKAVSYLHLAGERAVQLSAYQDAIKHLNTGLELLKLLPNTSAHRAQELSLLLGIGKALKGIEGMAPPQVEKVYTRAYYLAQQDGEPLQTWIILGELAIVYYVRAEYLRAKEFAQQTLELAQNINNTILIALSHWIVGFVHFALGKFDQAHDHFQRTISSIDPVQNHQQIIYLRGTNSVLSAIAYDACSLWVLGYPEQALQTCKHAFALTEQIDHPFTLADVITFAGCLFNEMRGNPENVLKHADSLIELSQNIGMGWIGAGWRFRGQALLMLGRVDEGNADVQKGLKEEYARAAHCYESGTLGYIGYAQALAGQLETGQKTIQQALDKAVSCSELYSLANLHRIQAEIHLLQGDEASALQDYQQALSVARDQNAKFWELEAALGLAKLLANQAQNEQAVQVLKPVYQWFSEGFDTPSLVQARNLLEELEK